MGWIWLVLIAAAVAWVICKKRKVQQSSYVYEEWPPKKKPLVEFLEQGATYSSLADEPDELIERILEKKPDLEAS